jgi:DnaJ-domain-containing protein 1
MEAVGESKVFAISRGIASQKLIDHYAVLGLPLTKDAGQIRKKYLKIAKNLHPDLPGRNDEEKEFAKDFLAKMVNPAYQLLSSDRDRGEYFATLRLIAQGLRQKQYQFQPQSEIGKKLQRYSHETNYVKFVSEIAALQYQSLDKLLEYTNDLSELNLMYLMMQDEMIPIVMSQNSSDDTTGTLTSHSITSPVGSGSVVSSPVGSAPVVSPSPVSTVKPTSPALRNIQLSELMIGKRQWTDAMKELRAGEKLDPNNAKLYALMGVVHMNQNAAIMAKSSFQKALKLDPQEPTALKYVNQVSAQTTAKTNVKKDEKKGGFFGWGK